MNMMGKKSIFSFKKCLLSDYHMPGFRKSAGAVVLIKETKPLLLFGLHRGEGRKWATNKGIK